MKSSSAQTISESPRSHTIPLSKRASRLSAASLVSMTISV